MWAKSSMLSIFALLTLLLVTSLLNAETTENGRVIPEIKAMRINPHAPKVDGFLDDEIWIKSKINIADEFTQRQPDEGEAPTESTHVAIVYDDEAIYFGFWVYDSEPELIQQQLVRRDRYGEADRVAVRLDPYHDHQTGFGFELNCSGVMIDYTISNDNWTDHDWDGVWEGNVQMQPWGWSAEIKIPYHCLRFPEKEVHTWGVDLVRWINRKNESDRWAFVPVENAGFTSNFGHLTGLEGITPARHLEILPYAVSSVETDDKTQGNPDGKDFFNNTGVDVKYGVSSNLTLDMTINPDFGQVELDRPVLNLSAFETYFSEKRPFFVEGSSMFATRYDLFYSRRIGRQPSRWVDDTTYAYTLDRPKATSIISAAKLTGKLSSGTSIAFLNAVTAEEKEEYFQEWTEHVVDPNTGDTTEVLHTGTGEQAVETQANYSVLRVKQDILKNSSVGLMLTNASQDARHPATTGGIDWRLQTNDNQWQWSNQVIFNRNNADHTGFGLTGEFQKNGGKYIRGSVYYGIKDPHFNLNRMGYSSRNGYRNFGTWTQLRTTDPFWIFRRTWNNINTYFGWNYEGNNITRGGNFNFHAEFMNYWSIGGGVGVQMDKYDDYETRGNGIWEWPNNPTYNSWFDITTDTRKNIYLSINPGYGTDREGDWWANYIGVTVRPTSNVELDMGVNYHRTFGATRWVSNERYEMNPGDTLTRSVFGSLDKDQITPSISTNILFNRNLSLQVSAQVYIAGLNYRDFRFYNGGNEYEAIDPTVDGELYDDLVAGNNYNYSAINSTMILRWEYIPGSTLYLVWTRSRSEVDDQHNNLDINRDINRLFSRGATNIFLIKASYWWNV